MTQSVLHGEESGGRESKNQINSAALVKLQSINPEKIDYLKLVVYDDVKIPLEDIIFEKRVLSNKHVKHAQYDVKPNYITHLILDATGKIDNDTKSKIIHSSIKYIEYKIKNDDIPKTITFNYNNPARIVSNIYHNHSIEFENFIHEF
ncbi:hypothetical protein CENSYa_1526 [Cenarchaeum symbiosum A]|uniref:Uncharacterized protein n=1 Tax=Cenarchaeum symbiosum (strain A) TaxID=414004 RepID=A0RXT1_CENSY|nr:hypothetical protein CENSYa_1526 [Cenarchaeum symbiosum A]